METIRYAFTEDKKVHAIPSKLPTLFNSKEDALNALQVAIENMVIHEDDVQKWELIEVKFSIVANAISKYQ